MLKRLWGMLRGKPAATAPDVEARAIQWLIDCNHREWLDTQTDFRAVNRSGRGPVAEGG